VWAIVGREGLERLAAPAARSAALNRRLGGRLASPKPAGFLTQ